ncbi:DSC E3 ubiquitin ligase complex subunit 4-like protein [Cladobotryum mycophilum]|uniref:DSC E3 ubiquitin ligase complex subunit 4-like protein n=1 Tax=Cladobotryum mycophilum TaxID=491253 RepID=A0ABR0SFD8_9HYPO
MNNDASPTPSARTRNQSPRPGNDDDDAAVHEDVSPERDDESQVRSQSRNGRRRRKKSKKKRNPGLVKKLAFTTHLLKTLDLVVFAELSSLYYMECSMFRFAIRAAGQYMYLTPKDEAFPFVMPASRVHVVLIVIPNIICMLLHLFGSLPVGPDFHRGYQHGGLIIDFIGQKPPASRLYYFLADLVVLALQCLMLTIHTDRENLRVALKTFKPFLPELVPEALPDRSPEDLDAEERGVSRHAPDIIVDEADGIELQSFGGPDDGRTTNERPEGSGPVSRDNLSDETSRTYLSDLMSSGNATIGEYHILHSIRRAAMELERTAAHSLQTIGYRATLAAIQAQRRNASVQNRPAPPNR